MQSGATDNVTDNNLLTFDVLLGSVVKVENLISL